MFLGILGRIWQLRKPHLSTLRSSLWECVRPLIVRQRGGRFLFLEIFRGLWTGMCQDAPQRLIDIVVFTSALYHIKFA